MLIFHKSIIFSPQDDFEVFYSLRQSASFILIWYRIIPTTLAELMALNAARLSKSIRMPYLLSPTFLYSM